jgi:hypothetical protein
MLNKKHVSKRELNVVGAPLSAAQRVQALVEFLDLISLQRLSTTSRAEKEAAIDKSCIWYVFNTRISGCMPSAVIARIKANKLLKGLQVTLPIKLNEIATFQSRQIQILDLRNVLTAQSAPLLVKIIGDQPLLMSLNMSKNRIKGAEAGKAIGGALAGNTVLKELDLSGEQFHPMHNMDIGFVRAFAPGLSDNRAMTSLNRASNELGVEGAKILAACLPKCT